MSKNTNLLDTVGAAFAVTLTLALVMVFSQGIISDHSTEEVEGLYGGVTLSKATKRNGLDNLPIKPSLVKQSSTKTERAKKFSGSIKSEKYWKELYASMAKSKRLKKQKKKTKKPPVVIGSND